MCLERIINNTNPHYSKIKLSNGEFLFIYPGYGWFVSKESLHKELSKKICRTKIKRKIEKDCQFANLGIYLTPMCNMNCKYCYQWQEGRNKIKGVESSTVNKFI